MEAEKNRPDSLTLNQRLKKWARALKREVIVMYFVMRHPDTPTYIKVCAAVIVGYALSPIDLIPDFVPVLGYLDEVILLPLAILLLIRLIPANLLAVCRKLAEANPSFAPGKNWLAAYVIVSIWAAVLYYFFVIGF